MEQIKQDGSFKRLIKCIALILGADKVLLTVDEKADEEADADPCWSNKALNSEQRSTLRQSQGPILQ